MENSFSQAFIQNFLGKAPGWYKLTILFFLVLNPILYFAVSPFLAGWLLVIEFIFTLAMALKCYPLQPGGLLTIEAVAIGMTNPTHVKQEVANNLEVILLLIFMVAGIYFMKQLLLFVFTKLLIRIRSKTVLAFSFCIVAAFLSAFLDALTVIAVVISVAIGFYTIYHHVASDVSLEAPHDVGDDRALLSTPEKQATLEQFRSFLRSLLMHAGVGTALGGVMTMVGEPQNLIIAKYVGWDFPSFLIHMSPVTVPVLFCGLLTCILVERWKIFGYGATLPETVHRILADYDQDMTAKRTKRETLNLIFQAMIGVWLVVALALHLAEVGLIGLTVIILSTSFCGVIEESELGKAFEDALPFTALLTVFFAIVAIIVDQSLFSPIIEFVLASEPAKQLSIFYIFNGILSSVSDNVFVGTIYINEARMALEAGTISLPQYNLLAVAINTGTNLPSVATPNGQAAFLFLLTSALAPLVHLSYGRMVIMALPYTIVLTLVGLAGVEFALQPMTEIFYQMNLVPFPVAIPPLG